MTVGAARREPSDPWRRGGLAATLGVVRGLVVMAAAAVLAAACSGSGSGGGGTPSHRVATADYRPGIAAEVYLPSARPHRAPLVVLVPGGGWASADFAGLRPLADQLAGAGIAAVTASYRTAQQGAHFPVPATDVECAVDFAVARVRAAGIEPSPVILAGHSAGAHLALLVALAGPRFRAQCPYPAVRVEAAIGLAGPYDIAQLQPIAQALFARSPADDPAAWRAANPFTWARLRPDLRVLLLHGADDTTVPPSFTTAFASRLRATGHAVQVELIPGADHAATYRAEVVGDRVVRWIRRLP